MLGLASACNSKNGQAERALTDLKSKAQELMDNPERSIDEIQKLAQIEYQVSTLPKDTSTLELSGLLNELGKDRWDCFSIHDTVSANGTVSLQVICKRPAATPLRYIAPGGLGT